MIFFFVYFEYELFIFFLLKMSDRYYINFYNTNQIGYLGIASKKEKITNIIFGNNNVFQYKIEENYTIKNASLQIFEYLEGERKFFDLNFEFNGTEFQKKVWKSLLNISYGETRTYKQIAELISAKKCYRTIGSACNKNPLPIIVPCHRVIGSNGKLIGYASGINLKTKLLNIEAKNC